MSEDIFTRMERNFRSYHKNPSSIAGAAFDILESTLNGDTIPNPTNPFTYLLLMAATSASAAINETHAVARRKYRRLSQTIRDLHQYMTDAEANGRFSLPGSVELRIQIPENDIKRYAVPVPSTADALSRIILPKDSYVTINGKNLSLYYPMVIDVLSSGGLQIYWDDSKLNPLHRLDSNVITYTRIMRDGAVWVDITIPMYQFSTVGAEFTLDATTTFRKSINFSGQYYACRAFTDTGSNASDPWEEIGVSYSLEIYDPYKPTLLVEVADGFAQVFLPDIFTSTGAMGNTIRIELYTTDGVVSEELSNFSTVDYSLTRLSLNARDTAPYYVPWDQFSGILIFSIDKLDGGRNALSFGELRDKLIYHSDDDKLPVTPGQLETYFKLRGYVIQKFVDNVTDRTYVASRHLPNRTINGLELPVDAMNTMVDINPSDEAYSTGVSSAIAIHDSGRITLRDTTVFQRRNGVLQVIPNAVRDNLHQLKVTNVLQLASILNAGDYFYTPFTYILDANLDVFQARPYYLGSPRITERYFVDNNERLNYSVLTSSYSIEAIRSTLTGAITHYEVLVTVRYPDSFFADTNRELAVQLAYNGNAIMGQLYGASEYGPSLSTFLFHIPTDMDIDLTGAINLSGTFGFVPLESPFTLLYAVKGNTADNYSNPFLQLRGALDSELNSSVFVGYSPDWIVATKETLTISFGQDMGALYTPSRVTVSGVVVQRYTVDVPLTYSADVFEPDLDTIWKYHNEDGTPVLDILHHEGDPVLDTEGNPIYLHRVGDPIINPVTGEYVIVGQPHKVFRCGLTVIDAKYLFVTAAPAITYAESLPEAIVSFLENDISAIRDRLRERTALAYKPRGYAKNIDVYTGGGVISQIPASIDFNIAYYMTDTGFGNVGLRDSIEAKTRSVITNLIKERTISVSETYALLKSMAGSEVVSIDMDRFGPDKSYPVITLVDDGTSFTVNQVATILSDGTLDVMDTVNVRFMRASG